MTETTDILIIGGGMAGISAAARLAPHARVIVLEAEARPAYHSTGRSAAVYIRNYGNATLRALNAAAWPDFQDWQALADGPILTPRGVLTVAGEAELAELAEYEAGSSGLVTLTGAEAVEAFPLLDPARVVRALLEPEASDIDVDRLLQGFLKLLRDAGGKVVTDARVSALEHSGVWRAETPVGSFEAPLVVNAAGAWADHVAGLAGIAPIGLQPYRRSIAVVPLIQDSSRWPVTASAHEDWYAKPETGRLLISPADEDPVEPHDVWADDLVVAEGIARAEAWLDFEVTRVERTWAGLRTFAPDRTLVAGFEPEAEGFFWLAGQGGYGIQTAPAMSRIAAALVQGEAPEIVGPEVVTALSPARFR